MEPVGDDEGRPAMFTKELSDMFERAKEHINFKRDKQEEITRYSRDITWECKQIIFTLHKFFRGDRSIKEGRERLNGLLTNRKHFLGLAKALDGQDFSLHHRQYTHCLQEYVEAVIFLSFLENKRIPKYEDVRDKLVLEMLDEAPVAEEVLENGDSKEAEDDRKRVRKIVVPLSITDYILGLGDFTGELMKSTVPTLTKPQWHTYLFQAFVMVREIYYHLMGVVCNQKDFRSKMRQMRANVLKIETTVYKLKIKILLYGRLPNEKELRMIQESATALASDRSKTDGNNADDSGVD